MPDAPDEIYIRTARQLNNLSLYYDKYSAMLSAGAGFLQGRSIDYASYDWTNFGLNGTAVKEQQPIGRSEAQPFRHTCNGGRYEITGISFLTQDNDRYTGMFGYNTGSLNNIALTGDDERTAKISVAVQRMTAGAGVLAGWNAGQIYNCAASGYRLDGDAYSGSTYYLGGLVGYNAGTIRSSGVSSPGIEATATYATVRAGGFVGANRGQIRQSYAFCVIQIPQIRDSKVALAGFAAENRAGIRNSYCATALSSMNADTYGFAP